MEVQISKFTVDEIHKLCNLVGCCYKCPFYIEYGEDVHSGKKLKDCYFNRKPYFYDSSNTVNLTLEQFESILDPIKQAELSDAYEAYEMDGCDEY